MLEILIAVKNIMILIPGGSADIAGKKVTLVAKFLKTCPRDTKNFISFDQLQHFHEFICRRSGS